MGTTQRDVDDTVWIQLLENDGARIAHEKDEACDFDATCGRTGTAADDHEEEQQELRERRPCFKIRRNKARRRQRCHLKHGEAYG